MRCFGLFRPFKGYAERFFSFGVRAFSFGRQSFFSFSFPFPQLPSVWKKYYLMLMMYELLHDLDKSLTFAALIGGWQP